MSICINLCMSRLQSQIVRHNNWIEATIYYLYVGVVRLGNFTSYWVYGGMLFLIVFNQLSGLHF